MIYRGKVRNGVVILSAEVHLPDGLDVAVQPIESQFGQPVPANWLYAMRNGVPVFPPIKADIVPDLDLVNQLRDQLQ